jgi:hypothetical protein
MGRIWIWALRAVTTIWQVNSSVYRHLFRGFAPVGGQSLAGQGAFDEVSVVQCSQASAAGRDHIAVGRRASAQVAGITSG